MCFELYIVLRSLLFSTTNPICTGEGGAAQVYRGVWLPQGAGGKGKIVAIKKLKVMNDSSSIDVITDVNISKAFDEFRRECWVMRYFQTPLSLPPPPPPLPHRSYTSSLLILHQWS